jgi:hypothetical protein
VGILTTVVLSGLGDRKMVCGGEQFSSSFSDSKSLLHGMAGLKNQQKRVHSTFLALDVASVDLVRHRRSTVTMKANARVLLPNFVKSRINGVTIYRARGSCVSGWVDVGAEWAAHGRKERKKKD